MLQSNPKVRLLDGNMMPLIGLGTMNIRPADKTFNLVQFLINAFNIGYTHLDLSKSFQNQVQIGEALKAVFEQKTQLLNLQGDPIPGQFEQTFKRQNMFLSLKVNNIKNKSIIQQLKETLPSKDKFYIDLKVQYVDLLILNFPYSPTLTIQPPQGQQSKPIQQLNHLPLRQAWKQMEQCKSLNLCKSIGVSNFSISTLVNLIPFTQNVPVVNQIQSHPWNLQLSMHTFLKKYGIVMGAYCPLARGGKDQKTILGDKIDYQNDQGLKHLADKYSKSIYQLMLNYQLVRGVYVTPKTEKLDHLRDNFNVTDFQLLEEDRDVIDKIGGGRAQKVYQPKQMPQWKGIDPLC